MQKEELNPLGSLLKDKGGTLYVQLLFKQKKNTSLLRSDGCMELRAQLLHRQFLKSERNSVESTPIRNIQSN